MQCKGIKQPNCYLYPITISLILNWIKALFVSSFNWNQCLEIETNMFIFEKKNTLKLHISIFRGKIAGKDTSFGLIYGQTGNKFWVEKSGRRTENNPFPINHSILLPLFGRRLTFVPPQSLPITHLHWMHRSQRSHHGSRLEWTPFSNSVLALFCIWSRKQGFSNFFS